LSKKGHVTRPGPARGVLRRRRLARVAILAVTFGLFAGTLLGAFAVVGAREYVRGGTLSPAGIKKPTPELPGDRPVRPLGEMSRYLPEAVIAVEDDDFRSFPAVDPIAIGRAALADLSAGDARQGGSTLTEQLMKQLFVKPRARTEKLLSRRLDESVLAVEYARYHSEGKILCNYLNTVYFGEGAYGVEAASRVYFGVSADKLRLDQSATLAALIQDPGYLNPLKHPKAAIERRDLVLKDMLDHGYISKRLYERARKGPLGLEPSGGPTTGALRDNRNRSPTRAG
jgi:membrane peptidoglycan carboxypeptidase